MQHTLHMPHANRSFLVALAWLVLGAGIATATFALINIEDDPVSSSSAVTAQPASVAPGAQRYDSGPNEGAAQLSAAPQAVAVSAAGTRYDGGPNEGAAQLNATPQAVTVTAAGTRYDGGPDEGTRGAAIEQSTPAASGDTRYDGGPDEGTRGVTAP
jgi:hypothetical protein